MFKIVKSEAIRNKFLIKVKSRLDKFNFNDFCINNKINSVTQAFH